MSLQGLANAIQSTSLSDTLKDHSWVVPFMQSIHIIMVGVVFVSILMISLRLLGRVRADEPLPVVWKRFAPFLWTGLVIMAFTGVTLTIAEPVREFMTLSFRLKMILLVICISSAVAFGRTARGAARAAAGAEVPVTGGVRATAVITLVLWVAIIFLGRAIAYDNSVWGGWSPVQSLGRRGNVNAPSFIQTIESSAIGEWLRSNEHAMPWVNAAHVLCITLVYGSILVVDLRLLGLLDRARAVTAISHEMLRVTWTAFIGAAISGAMFFAANATTYWFNTAFRFKMLAILLAGINMLVFQLITWRGVSAWDRNAPTPGAARLAGALSLLIWTTVIVLGRVIGFTKGGIEVPVPNDLDLDFSL